ncbi:MAG: serine--tRNA ligase [Chitinivibrionales bacterium]|nr:serine--tRNA ligase [Chitinivibrionales bacterium]
MLDMQRIRENPEIIKQAALSKNCVIDMDEILRLDALRRGSISQVEVLKNQRNAASQEIGKLKKEGKDAGALVAQMKEVSDSIKDLDAAIKQTEESLHELLIRLPNVPHTSTPKGSSAADNKIVSTWGEEKTFSFEPRDHLQIASALDILDFPRGAKITGAGFCVYKGQGALLERALINFFLDTHTLKNGYTEIFPPFLANRQSHFGTGQLPKSEEQMYYIGADELFCIPTAEVPVTNLHRDETLDGGRLPIKYCAYSACFRREAGSYGKDTKGFLRVHQFNKVELVKFADPATSYDELETLRADAESILRALGLYYRVVALCDADLSFAAAKCYDLEVWAPGEKKWLEVSSCSNFEDFQARRMNVRFKGASGAKPALVHTLNGSGVATARILVALLETYQTAQGFVCIPPVLQPYMHGQTEIGRN